MYKLRNYSEEAVDNLLDTVLSKYDNTCKCEKCKLDIKAYALNSITPKYVVSDKGEIYTRALNEINKQEVVNITEAIMKAIEIVSSNPKHD
ncbi:late competence development protein ComFB [Clostridium homopropionicum DSM 5847]|uniref:Late competence development protein ComFB n=1 Tax=Clostridium homopropionicum DSM 5847 TaxID=1121318 RepID=A0A0L6Z9Q6_9CLOT|nr:competence protein ComFB [Clostridium homopropionicum]KOA19690.1 late competence development protein ComFB [Clostridium homopropionicum DSM 5847]SFF79953.1 competence protein ComFB [Clostridium homopropionicum]